VREDYVQAYRRLYREHWWWRAREDLIVDQLRYHLGVEHRHQILDVGCGGGLFFDRLADFGDVEGIEPDLSMRLELPEIDSRIHWGPLETFRASKKYSVILLLDVLEHLPDAAGSLAHLSRLLQPNGLIVITVPAFPILWTAHDDLNDHLVRYTKVSLEPLAQQAGLQTEMLQYFFHWTFPAKLIVRMFEAIMPRKRSMPALPQVPPLLVNRALYGISRLEQKCGAHRVVPFGGSLLFVGRAGCRS
jgi:SAM-dependent methyltransferase